jgi:hypothetical protein
VGSTTSVYAKVVEIAKERSARAIITVNDARIKNELISENLQSKEEATATEMANECIYVTVSGPTIKTWTVSVSYERIGSEIRFHRAPVIFPGQARWELERKRSLPAVG